MNKIRPFQIALLAGFAVIAVIALFLLGSYQAERSAEESTYGEQVVIWGTLDKDIFTNLFNNISLEDKAFSVVKYQEFAVDTFDEQLVNAIAEGRSPDMVILTSEQIVKHRAKLLAVPYDNWSLRDFRSTYVDGAEVFALEDGIYGVPFAVDPLLLYWNRDMFASAGLAQAPTTWETVVASVVPSITVRTDTRDIVKSALAFGEYRNVKNAKAILLTLAMQSGSSMVTETDRGYRVGLNEAVSGTTKPMEAAVRFFTDFSNVNNPLYSWNRVRPSDTQAFISGDLAMYFGYASEVENVADKNPNLNFDTTTVPQGASATVRRSYGTFYAFAFPRASSNTAGAFNAAQTISNASYSEQLTTMLNMAPVRRSVIAAGTSNPFRAAAFTAALTARSWLDPERDASDTIFQQMIEDVVSNRSRITNAVSDAVQRLVLEY